MDQFDKKINKLLQLGRPQIAFGLAEPDKDILLSLKKSSPYADIKIVGPEAIKGFKDFEVIVSDKPEEKLASMLANSEVEGIVRGTIDDFKTHEAYTKLTGENPGVNPILLELPNKQKFFISLVGNPEGWTKEEKLEKTLVTARLIVSMRIEPKIAVLTGVRQETYQRKKDLKDRMIAELNRTYVEAEWLVQELKKEDFNVKNWAIDSNLALAEEYNLLVPPNGMVGNQMFRMVLASGGKILTGTRMGFSRPYEDNSRTEKDFEFHVKWLVAMINKKKHVKP